MPAPKNALKHALARGDMQIGLWLNSGDAVVSEIAGHAGFDWCLIDGEHAPYDVTKIMGQLRALALGGTNAVVRVPIGEEWVIKQVLDLGVQSLLIPMVESGDMARRMVAATRYPPRGKRGLGATVARASGYGRVPDYAKTIEDELCVILQAESRTAIENIDDIAGTEGVDCVFIGPADLSADLGHLGNPGHPEVVEAIAHGVSRIRAAGKAAGILHYDATNFAGYRDMGVSFLGVGADVTLLRAAMEATAKSAREAVGG